MASEFSKELTSDARLALVTLGDVGLRAEPPGTGLDRAMTLFEIGKPLAVVTYLACAPDRAVSREHLLDLLWGDVEPDAAKHALRQTLWYLKKRLGHRPLISGGDTLTLVGQLDCDRDAFLAAAERGDVDAVVQLYTGDFFPGFAAPGGVEFERWADAERQRLRSVFWRSAEVVVRRWLSAARTRDAQTLARRVRDLDPLREAGWRLLFEAIIASRDAVAATLEVDAFERICRAEGIVPERATQSLLRALRQAPAPNDHRAPSAPALAAELVGREHEFAAIIDAWEAARQGKPSHIHVVAPPGLGKTRLISDAHARLRASRARAVFVRATLGMRDIPFGLAGELALVLGALPGATGISPGSARALVALNPAVSSSFPSVAADVRSAPNDTVHRAAAALRELITVLADEQPLAVFVDDLQWADAVSRQILVAIAGTMHNARALLVTASRPTVDVAHASESTHTLNLTPLSRDAVVALVVSIATLPAEPWADQLPTELWHGTAGSPLLILESLQLVVERRLLERVDGEWRAPNPNDLLAALQAGGALRHRVERLERVDRWLLTLLAVTGDPLSIDVIAAALERTEDEVRPALMALEQRGILVQQGPLWAPSHDEIAAMTVELATEAANRAAARVVGRALVAHRSADLRALRQAGGLLERAGDSEGLTLAFSLFARATRETGDRRPNVALARDFVADRPTVVTRALARSLPLAHRIGLYSTRRQVAAAAVAIMVPISLALLRTTLGTAAPPPAEAVLVVGTIDEDSVARLHEVPIRSGELAVGQVMRPDLRGKPRWTFKADREYTEFTARPDGASWLVDRVSPDTGGIDVWEANEQGERRLMAVHGDDQSASWSPDGRWIVFHTAQWDPRSRYDLAIRDMRTGLVRQLTRTPDSDLTPSWSPDGSRIAFTRFYWNGQRNAACVIGFDGTGERCIGVAGMDVAPLRAWADNDHLLVHLHRHPTGAVIGRLSLATGAIDTIAATRGLVRVSPDGRWITCECPRSGFARDALILFPTDAPNRAVELDLTTLPNGRQVVGWAATPGKRRYADSLVIDAGFGTPAVGVSHSLTVLGVSPGGDTVDVLATRWRSSDTTIAVIDSSGVLLGRQPGSVDIDVSAGGWRTTRKRITIVPGREVEVLRETWHRGIGSAWRAFGEPSPRVDSTADGVAGMMNDGEGSHSSGVYSEQQYATSQGLALDVKISAPITDVQWQVINVALTSALDSSGLARWDHRFGALPRVSGRGALECGAAYPGGPEGAAWGDTLAFIAGATGQRMNVPPTFRTGKWFDLRIQFFSDGRCGFAVNGVPLWVSAPRALSASRVRVVFAGNSVGTTVLVGETMLRTGVPADIDWRRASPNQSALH